MTAGRVASALALVICAMLMLVFVDSLEAVGRYDAGVKRLLLHLPFASMLLVICATALLGRKELALGVVVVAFLLFMPLFVHECFPGLIGLFDPAYRSSYADGTSAPFVRWDGLGFAIVVLFLCLIGSLRSGWLGSRASPEARSSARP